MSTLQLSLLIIGIVVVGGVYLYNLIQERQARRKIETSFGTHDDILLEPKSPAYKNHRSEPTWAEPVAGLTQPGSRAGSEPFLDPVVAGESAAPPVEDSDSGEMGVETPDEQTECVVALSGVKIPADALRELMALDIGKPIRWLGKRNGEWQLLEADCDYREAAACVLLADRSGPVLAEHLDGFFGLLRENAGKFWSLSALPQRDAQLARAQDLDRICADLDIQVGLTLLRETGPTIAGTRLRGVAEAAGFRLNAAGQFEYVPREEGGPQFTLLDLESRPLTAENLKRLQTRGVTLVLDAPRVVNPAAVFDQMCLVSKRLATALQASLVDDNREPLTDAALGTIRVHIQQMAAQLRGSYIEPGSVRALRLFS